MWAIILTAEIALSIDRKKAKAHYQRLALKCGAMTKVLQWMKASYSQGLIIQRFSPRHSLKLYQSKQKCILK